jgi:hypothetical protein
MTLLFSRVQRGARLVAAFGAAALLTAFARSAETASAPAVLMISIDGLRPDYVTEADRHQLKIPRLREFLSEGSYATRVKGILPTVTYPSHTTLITGVTAARHGIYANKPFDRHVKDLDVWYCYAEEIKVPTLWDAAAAAGYAVGSVSWPVSVGTSSIRYNIPEYNLTRTDEDIKITRGAATPGLMTELEKTAGPYLTDANQAVPRDWARTRYTVAMIRQKHPRLLTAHLAASDHLQHRDGPFTSAVTKALEEIDRMVGEMEDAMWADNPGASIVIVSDHGFAAVDHVLALDAALVRDGLVTLSKKGKTLEESTVSDWIAKSWLSGGSAGIVLKDPANAADRAKVAKWLQALASDPANGVAGILSEEEIRAQGGAPSAQFWVDLRPGFMVGGSLTAAIASAVTARGTHGYAPSHDEMGATFLIRGAGIRRGVSLGVIDMRSIAPTVASLLNVPFPTAEMPALDLK